MSGDHETYEWFETPYGAFRVEQKRFGTWTSYDKKGAHHRTYEGRCHGDVTIPSRRRRYKLGELPYIRPV